MKSRLKVSKCTDKLKVKPKYERKATLTVLWWLVLCWIHAWQGSSNTSEQLKFQSNQASIYYRTSNCSTCLTLYPALALVSMNITLSSFAFLSPSSVDTCRLSDKSVLLPTNIIMTSLPRSVRTSSIHFDVWWNELASTKDNRKLVCLSTIRTGKSYLWYHKRPPQQWSLLCTKESAI